MSNAAIAFVIIGVVVVLAGLYLAVTARRDRASATGLLSRETAKRDRSRANPLTEDLDAGATTVTRRDDERAATIDRRDAGRELVPARKAAPPAPYLLDEEAYGG